MIPLFTEKVVSFPSLEEENNLTNDTQRVIEELQFKTKSELI